MDAIMIIKLQCLKEAANFEAEIILLAEVNVLHQITKIHYSHESVNRAHQTEN